MALVTGGPIQPAANTVADLVAIPSNTVVHDPVIMIHNTDLDNPASFGVAVAPLGAADATAQYVKSPGAGRIEAGQTLPFPVLASLQDTDKIRVISSSGLVNFFGQWPPSPPR